MRWSVYAQRMPSVIGGGWHKARLSLVGSVEAHSEGEALRLGKRLCAHPVIERDAAVVSLVAAPARSANERVMALAA
jgi:hypothetical protein